MLNNLLQSMKTGFVFVSQEIRKQQLHKKLNRMNRSQVFRDFCAEWTYVESIFSR